LTPLLLHAVVQQARYDDVNAFFTAGKKIIFSNKPSISLDWKSKLAGCLVALTANHYNLTINVDVFLS